MAAPAALLYGFLYLYPAVSNLLYSTQRWDGVTKPEFVGLHNFKYLIANDLTFHKIVGNNIRFSFIVVILQTLFSLLFAIFLVKNTKSNIFLRTVFFFPTILSSVSVGLIWTFLYNPNFGFINSTLKSLGLNSLALNWLNDARFSLYSIAIAQIWFHTGQMVVIYLAGLQQIPQELYESAEVDGASRWHQFRYVTWPMALPTTAVVVAYTTIQTFRAFDLVYSMTQGGPMNSSDLIVTNIFVLVITWIQRRTLRVKGGEK